MSWRKYVGCVINSRLNGYTDCIYLEDALLNREGTNLVSIIVGGDDCLQANGFKKWMKKKSVLNKRFKKIYYDYIVW